MLSVAAMKSGQCGYYLALSREDYFLRGGEPPGMWLGKGAQALGLKRRVDSKELAALFLGFSAAGEKLVQNAGKPNRQCGWDLTLSAPKSVSVLWSQLDQGKRQEIQAAQSAAVEATIAYIEENFAQSRIGKGGTDQVKVRLVVAAFEHSTSRALDPQLHSHCLVMNLGVDCSGITRSILSKPFYQQKMLAGAYYRCELACQLQRRLGVEIERPLNREGKPLSWFEIKDAQKSILLAFSKRRAAIEKKLGSRGMESASAAAFAALATRQAKTIVPPRQELHARWKEEGLRMGFKPEALLSKPHIPTVEEEYRNYRKALSEALAAITFSENYFTKEELTRRTLEAAQVLNLESAAVAKAVDEDLQKEPIFVSLGTRNGQTFWTTKEVLAVENEFLKSVAKLRERSFAGVSDKIVDETLTKKRGHGAEAFFLDNEQQAAVRYITQGNGAVKVISGYAGTGKTDTLAAAKEALVKGGYRVIGTALAGVAAKTLEEKTGIESDTVRMREFQLYPSFPHQLKHHARQLGRAALGKETWSLPQLKIDSKTVLFIDEAGMLGTRDFTLLANAVVLQGGSIVACGDERQLSAINRGGVFEMLVKELGGVRLTEIRRQQDTADRQAVKDVVCGSPETALEHYADKGQFYVGRTRNEAETELVADWTKNGGAAKPGEHRILAGTRAEVARFNQLCQWECVKKGQVDATQQVEHEGQLFMTGDRVRFDLAARPRGIQKGETGTIVAVNENFLGTYVAVALHKEHPTFPASTREALKHHGTQLVNAAMGRATEKPRHDIVVVPLRTLNPLTKSYEGLSLDYCTTTHRAQGATVKNSYVLLGGAMADRELTYVQSSRHKESLFVYASEQEAGKKLTERARQSRPLAEISAHHEEEVPDYSSLAQQMAKSRAKKLATTVMEERQLSMQA